MEIYIYIYPDIAEPELVRYTARLLFFNKGLTGVFENEKSDRSFTIGYSPECDVVLSRNFYRLLSQNIFSHEKHLSADGTVKNEAGVTDYLSTIYYYVNSVQEYFHPGKDQFDRFRYSDSAQYKFASVKVNFVQRLMDDFFKKHSKLNQVATVNRPSKIFLTHDIDSIYGAIKEDGYYALKHLKFHKILQLLWNLVIGKPDWLNMDKIMELESEYDFRSVFYWLVKKDRMNSDYSFSSPVVQNQFKEIKAKGWENGIHKSMSDESFEGEIKSFGSMPYSNRFHFLRFSLPDGYKVIEESGVKMDITLGYTETMGFRNSYGLPFMPYNLAEKKVYQLVEVPQVVMDRTFFRERKQVNEIKKELLDFFEGNKTNCVFNINWHSSFFSELKFNGYLQIYREMLVYFKETGRKSVSQTDIISEYYQPHFFAN